MRRLVMPFLISLLAAGFAATAIASEAAATTHTVNIGTMTFSPKDITITVGDSVKWVHDAGSIPHSVTADGGSFDSSPSCPTTCMGANATFTHTFSSVGTFPYHCRIHGASGGIGMSGTVTVVPAVAPITVTSVAPATRGQGATNAVTKINGTGFQPGATAAFSGSGVTVTSVTVTSPILLTLKVSVTAAAALGSRDATVTNPDTGTATCVGCLKVSAGPTITTVVPAAVARGATNVPLVVTGTHFKTGVKAKVSGLGITVVSTVFTNTTHATVTVTVSASAPVGKRTLTIINRDAGRIAMAKAIAIT